MKKSLTYVCKQINEGNLEKAMNMLDELISKDKTDYDAYLYRGKVKRDLNDYRGALEDYNIAAELNPEKAEVYNNRAKLFFYMYLFEKALQDINKANKLLPDNPLILFNKGVIESKLFLYQGAMESFNSAIMADPSFKQAYLKRGMLKEKISDFHGAYKDYSSVIKLNRKCAHAYFYRGKLLLNYIRDEVSGKRDLDIASDLGMSKTEIQNVILNNIPRIKILERNNFEKVS
jgi:tetratricopeptide (TPR) repeat protein